MTKERKILLSGVKPSDRPHVGNYFGAMKQLVDLQDHYQSFVFLADLHALTTVQKASDLKNFSLDLIIDYLAIGLEPNKVTLFKQSEVSAHAELCWIFNCLTTMPYLARAHAYKDAAAKNKEINIGLFDYPMLMAADILLYDADVVPVGTDQKQHVEYARDTAQKFNHLFGETFKLPEPLIIKDLGTVPGIDGRKMSKSYGNHIPLFATDEELKSKVMSIVTDSKEINEPKDPETCNVFALHKLFSTADLPELTRRYKEGGVGYKESKEILLANMTKFIKPLREKRAEIAKDKAKVIKILKAGTEKARVIADAKMKIIKERVGLDL